MAKKMTLKCEIRINTHGDIPDTYMAFCNDLLICETMIKRDAEMFLETMDRLAAANYNSYLALINNHGFIAAMDERWVFMQKIKTKLISKC